MKAWLSHAGVAFTVRNVEEDIQAYDELIALGYRTIPVTVIGERRVTGYDRDALSDALRAAGQA